jgi:hypothetical protein
MNHVKPSLRITVQLTRLIKCSWGGFAVQILWSHNESAHKSLETYRVCMPKMMLPAIVDTSLENSHSYPPT